MTPGGHHPGEADGLAGADAGREKAGGEVTLVELTQSNQRPRFADDEALLRDLEEEDAGPGRLGVGEAGVRSRNSLEEMVAELFKALKREPSVNRVLVLFVAVSSIVRLCTQRCESTGYRRAQTEHPWRELWKQRADRPATPGRGRGEAD